MTFTHEYANLNEIIKNFSYNQNNYLIEYLDGTISSYTCYDENEKQKIKNLMLEQAINREEIMQTIDYELYIKKYLCLLCFFAMSASYCFTKQQLSKFIELSLAMIFTKKYKDFNESIKELKNIDYFLN